MLHYWHVVCVMLWVIALRNAVPSKHFFSSSAHIPGYKNLTIYTVELQPFFLWLIQRKWSNGWSMKKLLEMYCTICVNLLFNSCIWVNFLKVKLCWKKLTFKVKFKRLKSKVFLCFNFIRLTSLIHLIGKVIFFTIQNHLLNKGTWNPVKTFNNN